MLTALSFNHQDMQTNHYNYYPENEVMAMDNQRTLTPEQKAEYIELRNKIADILSRYPSMRVLASTEIEESSFKMDKEVDIIIDGIEDVDTDGEDSDIELYLMDLLSWDCERMDDANYNNEETYDRVCNVYINRHKPEDYTEELDNHELFVVCCEGGWANVKKEKETRS